MRSWGSGQLRNQLKDLQLVSARDRAWTHPQAMPVLQGDELCWLPPRSVHTDSCLRCQLANSHTQQRHEWDLRKPSHAPVLFTKEIFSYLREKFLDLAFFLISAKAIHSSPSPLLSPIEGLAQGFNPQLDGGSLSWTLAQATICCPLFMPVLEMFTISRPPLSGKVIGLLLAGLTLIMDAWHPKHWPLVWQGDLVSKLSTVSSRLASLPEEAIDCGQLRPVSQHFLFLSWSFLFSWISQSVYPTS